MTPFKEDRHMIQIMPATGWSALYVCIDEHDNTHTFSKPLVAWALLDLQLPDDPDPYRVIEGLDLTPGTGTDFCESNDNFITYIHDSEDPDSYRDLAQEVRSTLPSEPFNYSRPTEGKPHG